MNIISDDIVQIKTNAHYNEKSNPEVSIVTSVYNRKLDLPRALNSVKAQTFKDIEYIIVDNGSTENLDSVISSFMDEVNFPVLWIKKKYAGPHVGRNRGKQYARGKYLVTLDSDDEIVPSAIELLHNIWMGLPADRNYWEVVCLCKNEFGEIVGKPFPTTINSLKRKKAKKASSKTRGEHFSMDLTSVHKKNLFPEPKGVTYIDENIVWNKINKIYDSYYINDCLRIYYTSVPSSIINNSKTKNIQKIYNSFWESEYVLSNWDYYEYSILHRIKYLLKNYVLFFVLKKYKKNMSPSKRNPVFKIIFYIPCCVCAFIYRNAKLKKQELEEDGI